MPSDSISKIDPGIRQTSLSIKGGQQAIGQVNCKSQKLAIVNESILPFDSVPIYGERSLIPSFSECDLGFRRSVYRNGKIAHRKQMSAK